MDNSRKVLKREVYRPQLEDGTRLKPVPGFTEGKTYSVLNEKIIDRCPDTDRAHRSISYVVPDDNGQLRHVDNHYFWTQAMLVKDTPSCRDYAQPDLRAKYQLMSDEDVLTELLDMPPKEAQEALLRIKKQKLEDLKLQILRQNPQLLGDCEASKMRSRRTAKYHPSISECTEQVIDLRKAHAKQTESGRLSWAGIDAQLKRNEETTLWQKAEDDANQGISELKVLAGLRRKPNSFDKMDELLESLKSHAAVVDKQIKELEFETRLLKKMAVYK